MGNEPDSDKDLELYPEDAEKVLGGRHKKAEKTTRVQYAQGLGDSTKTKTDAPSPLGPESEESYMDTNP